MDGSASVSDPDLTSLVDQVSRLFIVSRGPRPSLVRALRRYAYHSFV